MRDKSVETKLPLPSVYPKTLKGQMNQKIGIFSFVAFPSPDTKKNHPKWDLGKDFSSQAFIER